MTRRAGLASVAPYAGIAVVLLAALHDRLRLVDNRVLVGVALLVALVGVVHRLRSARSVEGRSAESLALRRRTFVAAAALAALSIAIAFARAALRAGDSLRDATIAALVPPLIGWSVFLLLPLGVVAGSHVDTARDRPAGSWRLPALLAATFLAIWLSTAARPHFDDIDEVLYAFQAHRFVLGDVTWAVDPSAQRFVKLPLMAVTPASLYALFPPGYPAILSVFVRLGVPALAGAALGTVAVFATYRLGARLDSPATGLLAALLLAAQPMFLHWASEYLSHAAAMAGVALAAWLLVDATERSDRRRDVESLFAGFLLGIAFTVRPVTALAIGLSIWLALLARRFGWSRLRRVTVMMCLGVVVPFAALLLYNAATTGDPRRLGYQAALGHLTDLGFGQRGFILYDADAQPVVAAAPFTLADALRNELDSAIWPFVRGLLPVWWLLPLVAAAVAYRVRLRLAVALAFAVLPVVNFFYFGNGERLYLELLPFALVAAALVVRGVHRSDAVAGRSLAVFLVGASLATSAIQIAADRWERARRPSDGEVVVRAVRDSSRAAGPLLVFVRNPPLSEPLLVELSQFNFGRFPGRVVVARDLGPENAQLACRLPGYRVLLAEARTAAHDARLVTYPDSLGGAAPCARPPLVTSPRPSA